VRGERNVNLTIPVAVIAVERLVLCKVDDFGSGDGGEILDVSWHNESGPYPPFAGTIKARAQDADRTRLDLAGSYHPPFGIAGIRFDPALGHQRAQEAVHELLATITSALERLDRGDESERTRWSLAVARR